jgi:hypothetical protein
MLNSGNGSNQSQDVDMLDSGNGSNQFQDVDMLDAQTDLPQTVSESERTGILRIAEAKLAAMEDGESEIGKLNYFREIDRFKLKNIIDHEPDMEEDPQSLDAQPSALAIANSMNVEETISRNRNSTGKAQSKIFFVALPLNWSRGWHIVFSPIPQHGSDGLNHSGIQRRTQG